MAEDDEFNNDLDDDYQPRSRKKKSRSNEPNPNKKCRPRIDQLAIPSRRLILALYQDHGYHLPREKVEKIKILLQELYAMTPEETERYFAHIKKKSADVSRRKDIKFMLKKLVKRKKKEQQHKQAYELLYRLFVSGMEFAVKTPVPPLVSVRLRNLSNIILEQICNLRNVDIPAREDSDQFGSFLIKVADWMAIVIEHLYYGIHLKKNAELQIIENEHKKKKLDEAASEHKTEETKDDNEDNEAELNDEIE
ncbi:uncharacterized protein LOC115890505 [Sitophilus oryzae]|uniref:Uncharacterized protein LOC115890505 n=1 Tax=Sitophilus oryzae TaxID=7048 RepID=A0A6J2YUV2_SITOR|nr:uncharacterized protein LOC115890505 [Sitophilus oryzae]